MPQWNAQAAYGPYKKERKIKLVNSITGAPWNCYKEQKVLPPKQCRSPFTTYTKNGISQLPLPQIFRRSLRTIPS